MRRTTTVGVRFPGPSPAVTKRVPTRPFSPDTPQRAIQPAHSQHGLPHPGPSPATFNKAPKGFNTPANAIRPVSGQGRESQLRALEQQADAQRALDSHRKSLANQITTKRRKT